MYGSESLSADLLKLLWDDMRKACSMVYCLGLRYHSVPGGHVTPQRMFSFLTTLWTKKRNRVGHKRACQIAFVQGNLKDDE